MTRMLRSLLFNSNFFFLVLVKLIGSLFPAGSLSLLIIRSAYYFTVMVLAVDMALVYFVPASFTQRIA